jgi:diguanylate cyclase (GGDEF)-like protein
VARLQRFKLSHWWARLLAGMLSVSLITGASLALHHSQADTHRGVTQRFDARTSLAANFVSTYVADVTTRERAIAANSLTTSHPTAAFDSTVRAFGFQAAVLLDQHGRVLSVEPSAPSLIGTNLRAKYAHLRAALNGNVAVSNVVPSAVRGAAVVAFAVPFSTASGRRVLSGAYAVSNTPLRAFLKDSSTFADARVYLTDGVGSVVASNESTRTAAHTLAASDPVLSRMYATAASGQYRSQSVSYTYARAAVPGTAWSMVISVPSTELFIAVQGSTFWLPWLILFALSLLIGLTALLTVRLLEGRSRLGAANGRLETIARTDGLTGLSNRSHVTEQLEGLLANGARHGFPLCVLMIDVDHFKLLNDSYGHQAGDQAICHVADRLTSALREGDLLGRWGGEEFLAVLPYTGLDEGIEVAHRIRGVVAATHIELDGVTDLVAVRTSVGVAEAGDDSLAALVHRADLGLYEAKASGRDTVRAVATADLAVPAAC